MLHFGRCLLKTNKQINKKLVKHICVWSISPNTEKTYVSKSICILVLLNVKLSLNKPLHSSLMVNAESRLNSQLASPTRHLGRAVWPYRCSSAHGWSSFVASISVVRQPCVSKHILVGGCTFVFGLFGALLCFGARVPVLCLCGG